MESTIIYVSFYEKKNSPKPLGTIFKITLKFITRPVLPHITVPNPSSQNEKTSDLKSP
jgi:hypothetical protein